MSAEKRLHELLEELTGMERADAEIDAKEFSRVAAEILNLDSENPRGKLALWASMDEEEAEKSLFLLEEVVDTLRPLVNEGIPGTPEDDVNGETYAVALECLGVFYYNMENHEKSLEYSRELVAFDDEGLFDGRTPLYCSLLQLGRYEDVLTFLEADPLETLVGEYARALALHGLQGDPEEALEALLQAFSMEPDLPFYVLGIWGFPEDDEEVDEEMMDILHQAMALASPCLSTPDSIAFLGGPAYMLGYLTDRIEDAGELELLRQDFGQRGIEEAVEEAKSAMIEMQEEERMQDEIDEEALQAVYRILCEELEAN